MKRRSNAMQHDRSNSYPFLSLPFRLTGSSNPIRLSFHSTHTTADGLLEGLTADSCEKGGRMSDNQVLAYRQEVQDYLRSWEHLLAAAAALPFSEEELSMVGYYAAEVQKILPVTTAK